MIFQLRAIILFLDYPSNLSEDGVCIDYKESLAAQLIFVSYLSKYLLWQVTIYKSKAYMTVLNSKFSNVLSTFEKLLCEISVFESDFFIILGGINTRSKSWGNIMLMQIKVLKLRYSSYRLHQLISQSTYLLNFCSY